MRDEKMDPALIENFIASLSSDLSLLSNLDEDFSLRTISHLRSSAEATSAVTRVFLKGIVRSAVMKQDDGNEVSLARQETEELGEPIGVAEAIRRETVELRREAIEFRREAVEVRREAAELKKAAVEFKREALGARKEAQQTGMLCFRLPYSTHRHISSMSGLRGTSTRSPHYSREFLYHISSPFVYLIVRLFCSLCWLKL